jgi:prepilin-type N-terminal cleavage/methylation domain-containing protein
MSDHSSNTRVRGTRLRDAGMTLPELLIAIAMMGLLMTVLSTAVVVTLRQQDNTEGRLNVAQAEQAISMWIPADLSSASVVDTSPDATPCGATVCDGIDLSAGSNVLMLSWEDDDGSGVVTRTNVSYHFAPSDDGQTFELSRVECVESGSGWSCSSRVVLRDLPGPPAGEPFVPGVANLGNCLPVGTVACTRPNWVIIVSEPLAPDAISEDQVANESDRKDANRVIVSINGGGDVEGAGGGINQISITAGGTVRTSIDANSVQGAPSFTEAFSRCGGPMTLVVDESNSIGTSIGDVKAGVRRFVEALAGTPVRLQVVRFHTYGSVLGSSDWHRYFDMTNDADVNTLLASIDDLRGSWSSSSARNGGTNWEEGMFRTFYQPDGSTAPTIPETVVFFTDGVPTFDRLDRTDGFGPFRSAPGVLPSLPAPPGLPWPESSGSSFSQVAFNRADFIANKFRRSVRMIGVGVGGGITQSSDWIVDPGAGYRTVVERGSYSHVRDSYVYQARYRVKNASTGWSWKWVDLVTYNAAPTSGSNRRETKDWTTITQAQYEAADTRTWDDSNDGLSVQIAQTPVSTAEYNANSSDPAYRAVTKTWSNGPDWEIWTGAQTGSSSHYRSSKLYNSPPYTGYDPAVTARTRNDVILARLISGNDNGTPAVWDGSNYTNNEIADMYVLPQWSQFSTAMEEIALGECGGTLTLQTKLGSGAAPDPVRYQNSAVTDSSGAPLDLEPTVVTTNQQFVTGTFDFPIPNGQFVTVDVLPQNYSELTGYTPGAWTCRAGNADRPFDLIDIPDAGAWKGVRVRVAANEAVSCSLSVIR